MHDQHSGRWPRHYFPPEFKPQTVELIRTTGKSIPGVARDLDLMESAARDSVRSGRR